MGHVTEDWHKYAENSALP